jgi:hypothetical protein
VIVSSHLLADLKRELRTLEDDLRARAEDASTEWGARLRQEHHRAQERERTGLAWIDWRDGEVSQAAVAWIIATVFIRFAEDNRLLRGAELDGRPVALPWIAAPGHGLERAVENEAAFYAVSPTSTSRDWLQQAFRTLAALPAGRPLVDPDHSPVWHAPISAGASDALLAFFRRTTPDGELVHDFRDPELGTRFLGDLYQDLSDYAKDTFALLQTPVFVEEFILDLTLTPAIMEFGLTGLKVIDPTCGSGHFLLGAFERITASWQAAAPGIDRGERVQRALDSIHGVDINPFAAAIARFRLTIAAIKAAGTPTLVAAPAFRYHLAIGDSLLGDAGYQGALPLVGRDVFEYSDEDLQAHHDILRPNQYHVVVGNPPYITVKDPVLNQRYRSLYDNCVGPYALSVPFMELFFRLARQAEGSVSAGYVGQITSNSFMTRDFGRRLVEVFLTGSDPFVRVDLTHVIDTSDVKIAGHSTPTVILVGRRRRPIGTSLRTALGIQGDGTSEADAERGPLWRSIVERIGAEYESPYIAISEVPRERFASHPWSLSGGRAGELKRQLDGAGTPLELTVELIGRTSHTGLDDAFFRPLAYPVRHQIPETVGIAVGAGVRDFDVTMNEITLFPYDSEGSPSPVGEGFLRDVWPLRALLRSRIDYGATPEQRGLRWYDHSMFFPARYRASATIPFAFVATHNHFAIDRGRKVFNRTAPVVKLLEPVEESELFRLLGVLASSAAAFWLRETGSLRGGGEEPWADRMEYTVARLLEFPLPATSPIGIARQIDEQMNALRASAPRVVLSGSEAGRDELNAARSRWNEARQVLVALQEELDWQVYAAYGLVDASLAPTNPQIVQIEPNERPFEVRLARSIADGHDQSTWFDQHGRTPLTDAPHNGSETWRDLWQARYEAAESGFVNMLERPEYKRRWVGRTWEQLVADAVGEALQSRLEAPELWRDGPGRPTVRSAAQVADDLRRDGHFRELLTIHLGSQDFDLTIEVGKLLAAESVPALAALRYKASGIEKFRAWERTWELQRAEDRGERVNVPVPPKYVSGDFLKTSYWSARGKLDVPKERFISFPGSKLADDATELFGWAGWDHAERAQAVAALANGLARAGALDGQVIPLIGVLLELEPWLKQWHDVIDPRAGVSPAAAVAGITTSLLGRLGTGRDTVVAWRQPAAPRRGRRSTS